MKKLNKKGLVGLAATAALVAGTAGTFALWFDTAALGAEGDNIATGDLRLDAATVGDWVWANQSFPTIPTLVDTAFTGDLLVPGDAVKYAWNAAVLDNFNLLGDTLVASFYLDGVGTLNADLFEPLVLKVGGDVVGSNNLVNGSFVIVASATEQTELTVADLPEILIGFPVNTNAAGDLDPVLPGVPVAPATQGNAWGRNNAGGNAIDISGLRLVLQQQVSGDYFGAPQ